MTRIHAAAFATTLVLTLTDAHAADPTTSCESGKLRASGKYASCVLSADARAVRSGNPADYTRCSEKLGSSFSKAEDKGQGQCPGGTGDQGDIQTFLDACRASVAGALNTGDTLPVPGGVARSFTDNGDGTITDNVTGLMWEKLSDDGSIHDKDDAYSWADATAVKVAALNTANFAGHNDWRLPAVNELQTLLNYGAYIPATYAPFNTGCTAGCTVATCSCTNSSTYWSSTTDVSSPTDAWYVVFNLGFVGNTDKTLADYVRAVRGGS